jgi:Domain of unknown function DUF11/Secretion system C-terminal sorting domain/CARDB
MNIQKLCIFFICFLYEICLNAQNRKNELPYLTHQQISPLETAALFSSDAPDLTISNLVELANRAKAGNVVTYKFNLNNSGKTTALGDYRIGAYLSKDNIFSSDDVLTGIVATGNTPVGTISAVQGAITIPPAIAAGFYYLILVVDDLKNIDEMDETNNALVSTFPIQILSSTGKSELELTVTPQTFPFKIYTYSDFEITVKNNGTADAENVQVKIPLPNQSDWVYAFERFMPVNANFNVQNSLWNVGTVAIGAAITLKVSFFANANKAPYTTTISVEGTGLSKTVSFIAGESNGKPDLSLSYLHNYTAKSGRTGSQIYYNFDLENFGTAPALNEYAIGMYMSTDKFFSPDDALAGVVPTGNTPIGKIDNVLGGITIPRRLSSGFYYLIMVVDKDKTIDELNENNNILVGDQIEVFSDQLIVNGGFEQYFECPTAEAQITRAIGWQPLYQTSSADYNNWGVETPCKFKTFSNGNAYLGFGHAAFWVANSAPSEFAEGIQTKLNSPMVAGKPYLLSFYIAKIRTDNFANRVRMAIFGLRKGTTIQTDNNATPVSDPSDLSLYGNNAVRLATIELTDIQDWREKKVIVQNYPFDIDAIIITRDAYHAVSGGTYIGIDEVSLLPSYAGDQTDLKIGDTQTVVFRGNNTPNTLPFAIQTLYPNPAAHTLQLDFQAPESGIVQLSIVDVLGKIAQKKAFQAQKGENVTTFQVENLPKGVYSLLILSGKATIAKQFVKL